jgi:hypothetical protein
MAISVDQLPFAQGSFLQSNQLGTIVPSYVGKDHCILQPIIAC